MTSNDFSQISKDNRTSFTTDASAPAELSAVVDDFLNTISNKFAGVSSEIFAKSGSFPYAEYLAKALTRSLVDEMSRRLDNLENSLKDNGIEGKESSMK